MRLLVADTLSRNIPDRSPPSFRVPVVRDWASVSVWGDANGVGINGDGTIIRNRFAIDQFWRRSVRGTRWLGKTTAGPSSQHEAAQSAIFASSWFAQTTRTVSSHAGAQRFFLRRSTHACVARTPGHHVLLLSVSACPFQQGATHRCADFHTFQIFSRLNGWKHVPAIASDPLLPTPGTNAKFMVGQESLERFLPLKPLGRLRSDAHEVLGLLRERRQSEQATVHSAVSVLRLEMMKNDDPRVELVKSTARIHEHVANIPKRCTKTLRLRQRKR